MESCRPFPITSGLSPRIKSKGLAAKTDLHQDALRHFRSLEDAARVQDPGDAKKVVVEGLGPMVSDVVEREHPLQSTPLPIEGSGVVADGLDGGGVEERSFRVEPTGFDKREEPLDVVVDGLELLVAEGKDIL